MAFENPQVLSTENYFPIFSAASQHSTLCGALWDHKARPVVELSAKNALGETRYPLTKYLSQLLPSNLSWFFFFLGQLFYSKTHLHIVLV